MLGRKPDGVGTDWLGPHWLAEFVGLLAFGFLIVSFIRLIRK